ncbi:MAG: glyoxalase [Acidimicrobiales bacterium]|nr:MAG: glyoxalase [Acidimicrobiales bacterium]
MYRRDEVLNPRNAGRVCVVDDDVGVLRLNHAVLYVSDARRSADFYGDVLGLVVTLRDPAWRFVFLRAHGSPNDHDLGLFTVGALPARPPLTPGLYHLAWEVETLGELAEMARELERRGALVGASDHGVSKSVYGRDPDGIEFEIMWAVPEDACTDGLAVTAPLDLEAEIARFGADTPGRITDPPRVSR